MSVLDPNDRGGRAGHRFDTSYPATTVSGALVFVTTQENRAEPNQPPVLTDSETGDEYLALPPNRLVGLGEIQDLADAHGVSLAAALLLYPSPT